MTADNESRALKSILPAAISASHSHRYQVNYLLSSPTKHSSLYSYAKIATAAANDPGKTSQQPSKANDSTLVTTCQHHLLLLSYNSKFIYALEILVYRSPHSSPILYISKADTTGYAPSSITRPITTAFLRYLLSQTGGGIIQLFARSQPQYIFPCSATNGKKRVLDDTQLIKWWLRVLTHLNGHGKVFIPGVDKYKIKSYYPLGDSGGGGGSWECAQPGLDNGGLERLAKDVIPVFPDDPKARFLHDLKGDGQLSETTLGQFWEMMEHRQECSSGRLVGFISMTVEMEKGAETKDGVVVDEKTFKRAYEMLLNGEYSSEEAAEGATRRWIDSVRAIIPQDMKSNWGFELIPNGKESEDTDVSKGATTKRPAEEAKPVNMLGGMLVRKKMKT